MALIEENRDAWLDPRTDAHTATDLMAPAAAGSPDIYAITKAVNNVRNNGPNCSRPRRSSDGRQRQRQFRPVAVNSGSGVVGAGGEHLAERGLL